MIVLTGVVVGKGETRLLEHLSLFDTQQEEEKVMYKCQGESCVNGNRT